MGVKFALHELVNGIVEGKRWKRRSRNTKADVKVEAPLALVKKVDLGTTYSKAFRRRWIVEITGALRI
jgi:hypothetical protein